jgi:hypothetical protein
MQPMYYVGPDVHEGHQRPREGRIIRNRQDLCERSRKGDAPLSKATVPPSGDANILQTQFIIRAIRAIRL